jgi:D-lactate dehydrogenase (cytochrome)
MSAVPKFERRDIHPDFLAEARQRFGERCRTGAALRLQHGSSESHFDAVAPEAVIYARTTEEVADCVKLCSKFDVPIIAYGAGTSMEGHTIPVQGGVTLDLSEMTDIVAVNHADFDCTVQAGVRREQLNEYLRDQGLFFPVDPGANATIGGMAATRASGTNAVRYGTMREAVLALKVVMPDGAIVQTSRRARKSAAGYDLTRLMIGSEGTLGIITEITLRLHVQPEAISSATCAFQSLDGAVTTVVESIQLGVPLARVEILDDMQIRAVNRRSNLGLSELPTLFFEFHGSTQHVAEQLSIVKELAAANGGGEFLWSNLPEERSKLWRARHEAFYASVALRPGCSGWPTDVCVPISRLAECIRETRQDLQTASMPTTIVGHVGDGNFHVIFVLDPTIPSEVAEVEALNGRLVQRALSMDGTCTGEHGIGLGKQSWLISELGSEAVEVMRTIKRALDPKNIFNPGKIFSIS